MRVATLALVAMSSIALGGCFQSSTVITVNSDGSGTIDQRVLFTGAALAQMRGLSALGGSGKAFDPVSEEQARQAAAALGPNVRYVSSEPVMTGEALGRNILYAFSDVNQLRVNGAPPAPGGLSIRSKQLNTDQTIRFVLTPQPDGHVLLRILLPQLPPPAKKPPTGQTAPQPDAIAAVKEAFAGARFSIVVKPVGDIVRTSNPWVDHGNVTLIDLEFDRIAADDAALTKLPGVRSVEEATAVLKDVPGAKINAGREITIEFTPTK
jgi:hypothetical protein